MNDIGQSDRILAAVVTVPTKTNDTIGLNSFCFLFTPLASTRQQLLVYHRWEGAPSFGCCLL